MEDHFATLGVPETANTEEITRAYRRLCHLHHPDKFCGDVSSSKETMANVNEAYRVLRDPDRRKAYTAYLHAVRAERAREENSRRQAHRESHRQARTHEQPRRKQAMPNMGNTFAHVAQRIRTGIDSATGLKWAASLLIAAVALWLLFGLLVAVVQAIIAAIVALLGAIFWVLVVFVAIVVLGVLAS